MMILDQCTVVLKFCLFSLCRVFFLLVARQIVSDNEVLGNLVVVLPGPARVAFGKESIAMQVGVGAAQTELI